MDPTIMQLLQMYQGSHQGQMYPGIRQQGGMFGGQQPMQQPQQPQLPSMAPPQQSPVPLPGADEGQHHHGLGGILPYLGFGLLGGSLLGGNMGQMAPLFGLAGLLGKKAFK